MAVKSIFQDALSTGSNYAQSATESARWGAREIKTKFDSHVIPRMNAALSSSLEKLNIFTRSSRTFLATPAGKITAGLTLAGVVSALIYGVWKHAKANKTAPKAQAEAKAQAVAAAEAELSQLLLKAKDTETTLTKCKSNTSLLHSPQKNAARSARKKISYLQANLQNIYNQIADLRKKIENLKKNSAS